jgi:hypothetical protein
MALDSSLHQTCFSPFLSLEDPNAEILINSWTKGQAQLWGGEKLTDANFHVENMLTGIDTTF